MEDVVTTSVVVPTGVVVLLAPVRAEAGVGSVVGTVSEKSDGMGMLKYDPLPVPDGYCVGAVNVIATSVVITVSIVDVTTTSLVSVSSMVVVIVYYICQHESAAQLRQDVQGSKDRMWNSSMSQLLMSYSHRR